MAANPARLADAERARTSGAPLGERRFEAAQYIVMNTGVKLSRHAVVYGGQNVVIGNSSIITERCIIRGDLKRAGVGGKTAIATGTHCFFEPGVVLRPPCKAYKGCGARTRRRPP